jgi:hypothetical protein
VLCDGMARGGALKSRREKRNALFLFEGSSRFQLKESEMKEGSTSRRENGSTSGAKDKTNQSSRENLPL